MGSYGNYSRRQCRRPPACGRFVRGARAALQVGVVRAVDGRELDDLPHKHRLTRVTGIGAVLGAVEVLALADDGVVERADVVLGALDDIARLGVTHAVDLLYRLTR